MLGQLQRIGKSLMLPIAVLPVAGLLLRLGQPDFFNIPLMANAGNAVFNFLPVLFAIGIAVGFAKENHGLAGLSGFISFEVLTYGSGAINSSINLGALGGIVAGLLAGSLFNQFSRIRTAAWLDIIYGAKGLAVIITTLLSGIIAALFGYIWPFVQYLFSLVGHWLTSVGPFGAGVYGLFNRLLIPFGLHHVLNTYIWFVYGTYHTKAGLVVTGDLSRFFAGDPTAGGYMAGFFPIMMFGLPAAALAMIATAKPERRKAVAGVLGSAAFTSFLTGVTEPIEFSFMFLAPVLFVIHAILTGISLFVTNLMGIKDGFSFSAGLIDYVLNYRYSTHGWWLIPIGLIFGVVYFVIFYFSIKAFDIKTLGREDEGADGQGALGFIFDEHQLATASQPALAMAGVPADTAFAGTVSSGRAAPAPTKSASDLSFEQKARGYLQALGGADNIVEIEACTTRLRLDIKDMSKLSDAQLKQLGASGVMKLNQHTAQVIVGTVAELLVDEIKKFM